jgi:uncharacterized protein (TIGR00369 family)
VFEFGGDFIVAKMPVEDYTRQSRGILHGGASCVLAEALGSIASNLCLRYAKTKSCCRSCNIATCDRNDNSCKYRKIYTCLEY